MGPDEERPGAMLPGVLFFFSPADVMRAQGGVGSNYCDSYTPRCTEGGIPEPPAKV